MIKSFCKINLSLRVLNKTKKRLHNIQTNTVQLNLCDEIFVKKIDDKKDIIIFKGKFKKNIFKNNNSISKTLEILRKKKLIKNQNEKFEIVINKKIPTFSGLGGGTSNAAFLIKHFVKVKNYKNIFKFFEKKIGSDLPLFIYKQCFQKSLQLILNYKKKHNLHILLVYPNIPCSTANIFSKVKKFSNSSKLNYSGKLASPKFIKMLQYDKNDLQKIVSKKFKIIPELLSQISLKKDCYFSRMTGSGSVCYGLFKSKRAATTGMKSIKKKFPKYWCVVTKTI